MLVRIHQENFTFLKREKKKLRSKPREFHDRHKEKANEIRFLRLHDTRRIFDELKKLTVHVFHTELWKVFVLLSWNRLALPAEFQPFWVVSPFSHLQGAHSARSDHDDNHKYFSWSQDPTQGLFRAEKAYVNAICQMMPLNVSILRQMIKNSTFFLSSFISVVMRPFKVAAFAACKFSWEKCLQCAV